MFFSIKALYNNKIYLLAFLIHPEYTGTFFLSSWLLRLESVYYHEKNHFIFDLEIRDNSHKYLIIFRLLE